AEHSLHPGASVHARSSPDGRVVALPAFNQGTLVLHRNRPDRPLQVGPQKAVYLCAVSPDGRWVAAASKEVRSDGIKVWEAVDGRLAAVLPVHGAYALGFSPDGRWLYTRGIGTQLWQVGTWRQHPFPGDWARIAFAPDNRLLAAGDREGV